MITLTDTAANKIQKTLSTRGRGLGIRVGVKTTGCSGLAYVLEFVDVVRPEDHCVDFENYKIYIDPRSTAYVTGTTIDFVKQGLNEGFEFINPNERDRCGCGSSFRV